MGFLDAISGNIYKFNTNIREPLQILIEKLYAESQNSSDVNSMIASLACVTTHAFINDLIFENNPPISEIKKHIGRISSSNNRYIPFFFAIYLLNTLKQDKEFILDIDNTLFAPEKILKCIVTNDNSVALYKNLERIYTTFPISKEYIIHWHYLFINSTLNIETSLSSVNVNRVVEILETAYYHFRNILVKNGIDKKLQESKNDSIELYIQLFDIVLHRQALTVNYLLDLDFNAIIASIPKETLKVHFSNKRFPDEPKQWPVSIKSNNLTDIRNALLIEIQSLYLTPIDILLQETGGIKAGRYLRTFLYGVYQARDWSENGIINLLDHIELRFVEYRDILIKSNSFGVGIQNIINKACETIYSGEQPAIDAIAVISLNYKSIHEVMSKAKDHIAAEMKNLP